MEYMDIYRTAAVVLKRGGVGVLPTDTLYGLVASAFSPKAVARVFQLKKRNPKKPPIILISSFADLARFGVKPDAKTRAVLQRVWPGKISVILPCPHARFGYLHRGTRTLAFRMPRSKRLAALLYQTGPLIAPSANPEGLPPAATVREARAYFGAGADFFVAARRRVVSAPSTLCVFVNGKLVVKRTGAFAKRLTGRSVLL